jgi:HEAT repeat protein/cyclophilin family peptidyl-prolyl cis-trans isomerase
MARVCVALLLGVAALSATACAAPAVRASLSETDVADLAHILKLEDTRTFDEVALLKLLQSKHPEVKRRAVVAVGRIVNPRGGALLEPLRNDASVEIVATVAFAAGQLRDPAAVGWLGQALAATTAPEPIAFEAARALGKIRTREAWAALASYLNNAADAAPASVVGEALLSIGRFTTREDITPIARWTAAPDAQVRWRATWALFRPRNPAAVPHLMTLAQDMSPEVRFWAIRGLAVPPPPPASADPAEFANDPVVDRAATAERLRAAVMDSDRRVRTEAVRALATYDDDESLAVVLAAVDDSDTWISISAAEALGRFRDKADRVEPKLTAATAESRPEALRTVARQQLVRLNPPAAPAVGSGGRAGGAGRQGGGGRQGGPSTEATPARTDADYRAIVERWIVPAYNGDSSPRAVWMTPKGEIEIELHPGESPLGMEEFVRLTESGDIVGTVFSRVVPNFVAQQATIRGANRLRDEVSRLGLTRGNLSWASAGLDTGRPGYTLGNTPQPHNEGDFTALGRVVRGMDVVDRLELGDAVTAARIVR